jgi:inhibitor of KinA sporulation pathway (predicted exonuclease)
MLPFGYVLFCSWGDYDRKQLQQDCAYHSVPYPMPEHLNLKVAFANARGHAKKKGVVGALKTVGLQFEGTHHRGIDDARNITRLATYVFEPQS